MHRGRKRRGRLCEPPDRLVRGRRPGTSGPRVVVRTLPRAKADGASRCSIRPSRCWTRRGRRCSSSLQSPGPGPGPGVFGPAPRPLRRSGRRSGGWYPRRRHRRVSAEDVQVGYLALGPAGRDGSNDGGNGGYGRNGRRSNRIDPDAKGFEHRQPDSRCRRGWRVVHAGRADLHDLVAVYRSSGSRGVPEYRPGRRTHDSGPTEMRKMAPTVPW